MSDDGSWDPPNLVVVNDPTSWVKPKGAAGRAGRGRKRKAVIRLDYSLDPAAERLTARPEIRKLMRPDDWLDAMSADEACEMKAACFDRVAAFVSREYTVTQTSELKTDAERWRRLVVLVEDVLPESADDYTWARTRPSSYVASRDDGSFAYARSSSYVASRDDGSFAYAERSKKTIRVQDRRAERKRTEDGDVTNSEDGASDWDSDKE